MKKTSIEWTELPTRTGTLGARSADPGEGRSARAAGLFEAVGLIGQPAAHQF
jgi:hypothetical protein